MGKTTTSQRLKEIMQERRLRQVDILELAKPYCEKYRIKLGKSDLSQFINGKVEPGQWKLSILGMALNVSEAWLMGYDVPKEPIEGNKLPNLPPVTVANDVVTFRVNTDIAAGYDQPAAPLSDWEGAAIDIPASFLHKRPPDDYFVIRICGDSMYPHYQDGDYVLVLKTPTLEKSGDVGVMLYNGGEGTIKKVEFVMGEDWLRLIPLNPEYAPRTISGADLEQCRVIGVPKLVIRNV